MGKAEIVVDLNQLSRDAIIRCPYCNKGKTYSYGARGKESCNCHVCKRLVLWDFDRMMAYKAKARKFNTDAT